MPAISRLTLTKLKTITLKSGGHTKRAMTQLCAMEAVAWLAGEKHSASPACACPVISSAVIRLNDRIPDDAMRTRLLRPLLPKILNTRSTPAVEELRRWIAIDFAVRIAAPLALDVVGWKDLAEKCRAIPAVTSRSSASGAHALLVPIRDEAYKRRNASAASASASAAAAADDAAAAADDAAAAAAYASAYASAAAADDASASAAYAASAAAAADDAAAAAAYASAYASAAYASASAADDAAARLAAREPIYRACVEMIERMIAVRAPKAKKRVGKDLAQQDRA
jgi:hypothetical protein